MAAIDVIQMSVDLTAYYFMFATDCWAEAAAI